MAYTPQELRDAILRRVDLFGTDYIGNTELDRMIDDAFVELWDFLSQTFDADFYEKTSPITTSSGVREYPLPEDFWRLHRLDVSLDAQSSQPLQRYNRASGQLCTTPQAWVRGTDIRYWPNFRGPGCGRISFEPIPSAAYTVECHYVPRPPKMSDVSSGGAEKHVYSTPGSYQLVIPDNVSEIAVAEWGAAGGVGGQREGSATAGGQGGNGGFAGGKLAVSPGDKVWIEVGAGGTAGVQGVTTGGSTVGGTGGGGGGLTGVFSAASPTQGSSRIVPGAGGGGSGRTDTSTVSQGGHGGGTFGLYQVIGGIDGTGGSGITVGAGGIGSESAYNGSPGSGMSGGAGGEHPSATTSGPAGGAQFGGAGGGSYGEPAGDGSLSWGGGGGGGAGYAGGGGGATGAGGEAGAGAGASGFVEPAATDVFMLTGGEFGPPNTSHPDYVAGHGVGPSAADTDGGDGLVVISYSTGHQELNCFGYDEYIILDTAIKIRMKQEQDYSDFFTAKEAYRQRIQRDAMPKDQAQPHHIADVRSLNEDVADDPFLRRRW